MRERRRPTGLSPGLPLSVAENVQANNTGELLLSALGYVSFLGVLPLLLAQKSPFCRFHGKQGLVYNIVYSLAHVTATGLAFALPGLQQLPLLVIIIHILIVVICIARSLLGHVFTLPFVSGIAKAFPV